MSHQAISKWKTDQSLPDIDNVLQVATVLGVSVDELLGHTSPASAEAKPQAANLEAAVRATSDRQLLKSGILMVLVGTVLLMLELLCLYALQYMDMSILQSWHPDVMHYASQPPMPLVFFITSFAIFAGIGLVILYIVRQRRR